jgi:PAS domain S-box-containing protein
MDAPVESSAEEVARLRDCLNDLASIMALPALSTGGEPGQIMSTLTDALIGTLPLTFVCVRLNDPGGGPSIETMRLGETPEGTARSAVSFASARLGLHGELGLVVAGSWKVDFPADTERLVLDVAANQAAIGLQEARLQSDQKRLASDLSERERESRLITDTIPGLVATLTPAGEVDVVNHELVEYCGQPLEAMRQWGTNGTVHADDVPRIGPLFTQAIASGEPYDFEARVRRFDGVYRWCQIRGLPHRDTSEHIARWYVLLTDIDDRKRADAELRRAYDSFADAQRLSKTGSFITDLVADDHNWSEEAYRIFEFDPGTKITVQKIRDIIHPDDLPSFDSVIARGMTGANVNFGFRIMTARNTVKHVRGVAHVVEHVEGRPMFVGALQDVTESMVAEEALSLARSELAHVSRVTTLSALTASIAHEVNQPLSGIITNASTCLRMLAADPPDIDGARLTAKRTIRDGNRASDVIARLRELFIRKEFTLEPMDLNEAAREVIALTSNDLQRDRVILQSELADGLPFVTGDRIQLQQVILNLLRNASDAMVDVRDRPRQLLIKTEREDGQRVRLAVCDAGIGLSPRSMDSLFDAFYTTKSGGMGIGLFVSRSIVEKHHGRLWAQPNDGPGATFLFSIPCVSESVADAAAAMRHS